LRTALRAAIAAALGLAVAMPATASAAGSGLNAYEVKTNAAVLRELARQGFDMSEARQGNRVEIAATKAQVAKLRKLGLEPVIKRDEQGLSALQFDAQVQRPDGSYDVYRPYFDPTYAGTANSQPESETNPRRQTLYEELTQLAAENTDLVKPVVIGRSVNGTPILALRVTRDAREPSNRDGSRPAVLYSATQHAREWIVPETARRLLHYVIDEYRDGNERVHRIVDTTELWFVVVANPDGYDFTFTPGNRLWRKNLREINGQPGIQSGDGVDPNRNFSHHWNYDDEGSSSDPPSETYRGSGPNSEPETQAMDGLLNRIGFEFQVNYHSAAELLLYPFGFQVETYTADDPIYRALSGNDDDPAIVGDGPGAPNPYDPDVGAELYTTNGETTDHAHSVYGTLAWTPEMDVAAPDRGGGESVFEFQDSEPDLQAAFEKNIPFALDVAESAQDPANPVSHLGNDTPDFEVESFSASFGDPQTVEANVKRELGAVTMHYTVNGGGEQTSGTQEWGGGERYGGPGDVYYHRVRGTVRGTSPGDRVRVWFEAGGERSQSFVYGARSESGKPVLILSAEDYSGKLNTQDPGNESDDLNDQAGPDFLSYYQNALDAAGVGYDVYDVDAEGRAAPDRLGVLSHYRAVVWYTGDDLFVRESTAPGGTGTSKLADDEILAVRSYLNEGGKLLYTGKFAAYNQLTGFAFNPQGQPPYCDAAEAEDPENPDPNLIPVSECALLSNDFLQYYLGAYLHIDAANSTEDASLLGIQGAGGAFGTTSFSLNGPDSAANQTHVYSMVPTSDILPASQYPLFSSAPAALFQRPPAFDPTTGSYYMFADSSDEGYQRLHKTIDLTGVTSADMSFKLSHDTEVGFDYVVVEAHPVGSDDWTTLPDENGNTSDDVGASCDINWDSIHPFLDHFQTNTDKSQDAGDEDCINTGTTGAWHGASGNSGGFDDWKVDLSQYAGQQVEVSISYIQDFAVSGLGVFLDDVVITKDGAFAEQTSFEDGTGGFTAGPAPEGTTNQAAWQRRTSVGYQEGPGVFTADSVYYGFGLEGVSGADRRTEIVANAMRYFGVLNAGGNTPPGGGSPSGGVLGGGSPSAKAIARFRHRTLRVDKRRRTKIKVRCPRTTETRCRGTLKILLREQAVARRRFSIVPDSYRTVTLRLKKPAFRELSRKGRLRADVILRTRGADKILRGHEARLKMRRK